jgi:GGDEF domain-containing protein
VSIRRRRASKSVRPTLLIRRDGNELYIESTAAPIRDGDGERHGRRARVPRRQRVARAQPAPELPGESRHPDGLVNRASSRAGSSVRSRAPRPARASTRICYLDLDQFKVINDSCGHTAGDALLGQLGALLKSRIRWRDTLARLGGDEFGVLMEC